MLHLHLLTMHSVELRVPFVPYEYSFPARFVTEQNSPSDDRKVREGYLSIYLSRVCLAVLGELQSLSVCLSLFF